MVKRYPHKAIVTFESNGGLVNGEWVEGQKGSIELLGRYDPVNDARIATKFNALGNEKQVHGYFYTKAKADPSKAYQKLKVDAMSIDADIICWEQYQTHSIICV